MLEGQLGVDVDETTCHHEVLGHPATVDVVEGPELPGRFAVELLAGDVLVDFG
ncbi:hypothetical protein [Nesterenkonia pannonica]|uniref:hypothetical protein n=1 Tax=Nesterenkonia pannonica TaxID=1548602 RepID=UPI00216476AE|nr:hypothetical protein [Nesterenkonia pannonica]